MIIDRNTVILNFTSAGVVTFSYSNSIADGKYYVELSSHKIVITDGRINLAGFGPGDPTADAFAGARNSLFASGDNTKETAVIATLGPDSTITIEAGTFVITAARSDAVASTNSPTSAPSTTPVSHP